MRCWTSSLFTSFWLYVIWRHCLKITVAVIVSVVLATWMTNPWPKNRPSCRNIDENGNPHTQFGPNLAAAMSEMFVFEQKSIYASHLDLIAFETKIDVWCDSIRMRSIAFIDIHSANTHTHLRLRHLHTLFASFFLCFGRISIHVSFCYCCFFLEDFNSIRSGFSFRALVKKRKRKKKLACTSCKQD